MPAKPGGWTTEGNRIRQGVAVLEVIHGSGYADGTEKARVAAEVARKLNGYEVLIGELRGSVRDQTCASHLLALVGESCGVIGPTAPVPDSAPVGEAEGWRLTGNEEAGYFLSFGDDNPNTFIRVNHSPITLHGFFETGDVVVTVPFTSTAGIEWTKKFRDALSGAIEIAEEMERENISATEPTNEL